MRRTSRKAPPRRQKLGPRKMDSFNLKIGGINRVTRSSSKKGKDKEFQIVRKVKAQWDEGRRSLFLRLCHDEYMAGNWTGSNLDASGWSHVQENFESETGDLLQIPQFKNFLAKIKGLYNKARKLFFSSTGLGLDPDSDRIAADLELEWWEDAIQRKPEIRKLRGKNIQELLRYGNILFRDSSSIRMFPSMQREEFAHLNIGSGGVQNGSTPGEKGVPIDLKLMGRSPRRVSSCSSNITPVEFWGSQEKEPSTGQQVVELLKLLINQQNQKSAIPPIHSPVEHFMSYLSKIVDIDMNLAFYGSVLLLENPSYREVFLGWDSFDHKMSWLRWMLENGYT